MNRRSVLPTLLGLGALLPFATTINALAQTTTPTANELKVMKKDVLPYVGADGKVGTLYVEHIVYHL